MGINNRYSYGFNNPMSGSDPTGFSWLSDILNGNSSSGWEGSTFFGAALGVVGGAYISSLAQAGAFAEGGSLSGFSGTSGLGGGAAIVEAFAGLSDPGANATYAAPTGELGQGRLYNEGAVAPLAGPDARTASSEVWAVHTLGTDYREHVTTPEEAVAVTLIALAPLAWEGAAALLGVARGSYTIAMSVEQAAVVLRSAPAGYRTMAQFGQRLGWGRGANAVETALARANSITLAEAKALGISSRQSFLIRDAYRAVLNSAKGLKNGATSNPTALGREVLLNRVGQLLQSAGL